jgi:ADP-ribosylglycohydrolase
MLAQALSGMSRESVLDPRQFVPVEPKVAAIAQGEYLLKSREQIWGTAYCVASLEAALWCFHRTDTFEAAILEGANLGDDADTTAAIVGQLAGAYYGMEDIPDRWLRRIHMRKEIAGMAEALHATASAR